MDVIDFVDSEQSSPPSGSSQSSFSEGDDYNDDDDEEEDDDEDEDDDDDDDDEEDSASQQYIPVHLLQRGNDAQNPLVIESSVEYSSVEVLSQPPVVPIQQQKLPAKVLTRNSTKGLGASSSNSSMSMDSELMTQEDVVNRNATSLRRTRRSGAGQRKNNNNKYSASSTRKTAAAAAATEQEGNRYNKALTWHIYPKRAAKTRANKIIKAVATSTDMFTSSSEEMVRPKTMTTQPVSAVATRIPRRQCPHCQQHFAETELDSHTDECIPLSAKRLASKLEPFADSVQLTEEAASTTPSSPAVTSSNANPDSLPSMKSTSPLKHIPPKIPIAPASPHKKHTLSPEMKERFEGRGGRRRVGNWQREVEVTLRRVRRQREDQRTRLLAEQMKYAHALLQEMQAKRVAAYAQRAYPRLCPGTTGVVDSDYIHQPEHPLPRDKYSTLFIKRQFVNMEATNSNKEGEEDGSHADDSNHDDESASSSSGGESSSSPENAALEALIKEFRIPDKVGAPYEIEETKEEIDMVLERLEDLEHDREEVHEYLALLLEEDDSLVRSRYELAHQEPPPTLRLHSTTYENVMSSFRDLFCRRCVTFDCNLHGISDQPNDPDLEAELAVYKQRSENNMEIDPEIPHNYFPLPTNVVNTELTETDVVLAQKLFHAFEGDLKKVALAVHIPEETLLDNVQFTWFKFEKIKDPVSTLVEHPKTAKGRPNYHFDWVKRIANKKDNRYVEPCTHVEPCSPETCSCIQNAVWCTKACLWGTHSRNFFRGCNCQSQCNTKSCSCLAANRECDPDLCKSCGACSDPPNRIAKHQNCRNDNITMRRHRHLLMAKSNIPNSGWGLFTKSALKKGDYIHEYLGELISHDEAERRGAVYDARQQTYLFDLTVEYALDALRKGNKTRFINHPRKGKQPNIQPLVKVVNGDYRIGFFALKDLPAQSELFFNYGDMFEVDEKGKLCKRKLDSVVEKLLNDKEECRKPAAKKSKRKK